MRVLVAGCGYVGSVLAELLVAAGHETWGLRRSEAALTGGARLIRGDVTDPTTLGDLPADLDALVYAVSPGGRSGHAYREAYVDGPSHLLDRLSRTSPALARVLLVSSTGVYGQSGGEWVDEETPPEPVEPSAEALLEGEARLAARDVPAVILRLGGIYGPGRTRLLERVREGDCPEADRYSNRIHRDDAAAAALHLLELEEAEPLYLGVDRDPAPLREVLRWIAGRMGAPDPCGALPEGNGGAGEGAGRRGTNKRCSSARLVGSGFAFRYPTYREGYATMLADG